MVFDISRYSFIYSYTPVQPSVNYGYLVLLLEIIPSIVLFEI